MEKNKVDFQNRLRAQKTKSPQKVTASRPVYNSGDFDEYLYSWINHTGTKVTAPFISNLLTGADEGSPADQAALFETILEKEPVIAAHMQTRTLAVLSRDWRILSNDKEKASDLTKILKRAGVYSLMKHLLNAIATGYAGSAVIWEKGGASIEKFTHIHPVNWIFDLEGNPGLLSNIGKEIPLSDYHPNQFILHLHNIKPGLPSKGGLLRTLVWLYFFKHYAIRDRARYLERFGIPFFMAKISKDDFSDDNIKNSILNSLAKMGSDGVGVVTGNSEVEIMNAGSNASNEFQEWFEYIDDVYALTILGQIATSKAAAGLSKGQMQENVRHDILKADCLNLMESINNQIIDPLSRFRYGSNTPDLSFSINYQPEDDLKKKAEIVKLLKESGFSPDKKWIEDTFNIPLEK